MLNRWASWLNQPWVRYPLMAFCLLATLLLLPGALYGPAMLYAGLMPGVDGRASALGWGLLGVGGLAGLAGAWVRLVLPAEAFQRSMRLRQAVATALLIGMLAALVQLGVLILRGDFQALAWCVVAGCFLAGGFLAGATLGEGPVAERSV